MLMWKQFTVSNLQHRFAQENVKHIWKTITSPKKKTEQLVAKFRRCSQAKYDCHPTYCGDTNILWRSSPHRHLFHWVEVLSDCIDKFLKTANFKDSFERIRNTAEQLKNSQNRQIIINTKVQKKCYSLTTLVNKIV